VYESCPHCGHPLSPWEKVLLNVDRALMCKHCWYRIMLGARPAGAGEKPHTDHRREQKP
jgi:DNA-directed RNA polymerase subunit RPC12/RpoP